MLPLAYFDIRPFLFVGGLPLFIGIVLLARWMLGLKWKKGKVSLNSSLVFTALFALFLTGFGPFVDQKEIKEFEMTWTIAPTPSNGMKEAEVILKFAEFPQYSVGSYSDELAAFLRERGNEKVKAKFRVTSDYGKVRGYNLEEVDGLRGWKSEWGYGSVSGSPESSPWN
jgi:hypothetical protein|tara:strand:+ start:18 stop:524 length:507 start_codon:yes stop_codon:yes gene_type:complete